MKLSLSYDFSCPARRFWELYFDPEFTTRLHLEALGSTQAEVVEQEGTVDDGVTRTLRYAQRPDAPGPVKKLFGDEIVTVEESTFDPSTSTSTFTLTPGTMASKTQIHGTIHVEDADAGCTQHFELEARVKIFGAGPIVERFIDHQARTTQDKAVAYMKAALAES